jgi:hypothetical protein
MLEQIDSDWRYAQLYQKPNRSDKKDKIPIGSDSRVQKPILATGSLLRPSWSENQNFRIIIDCPDLYIVVLWIFI